MADRPTAPRPICFAHDPGQECPCTPGCPCCTVTPASGPEQRRERYVDAILAALARDTSRGPDWHAAADAAMAVADQEQRAHAAEPDVRQVLVHPVVWPHLEAWLATRGIDLTRVPVGDDDLPTYAMTPTDAAMTAAARPDCAVCHQPADGHPAVCYPPAARPDDTTGA